MIEVLTPDEMADADRRTVAGGTPMSVLMERAGQAVADAVCDRHGAGARIVVLAGPGNNGGDGYVAARLLRARGFDVGLTALGAPKPGGAAGAAAAAYDGPRAARTAAGIERADVVIDGLFGGGLARPLGGEAAALVDACNSARANGASVYAIDLPSGVDGASGAVSGPCVTADHTVTFARRRVGHMLMPGRVHAGSITVADIGIGDEVVAAVAGPIFANEAPLWRALRPRRGVAGHKYDCGHAVVVSGPMAATGASRLAARAALRAGAGLVTLASPPNALMVNACHLTTVMLAKVGGADDLRSLLADARHNAVCVGPGLPPDEHARALVAAALGSGAAVVLDAGALTAAAADPAATFAALDGTSTVLTPHEGEFARLFGRIEGDKLTRARAAAKLSRAVVVLKGPDTVIAEPGGRAAINANAPPSLATAGTGDVLAGLVTGLLAQRVPPFEAAAMGVWLHGTAAHAVGTGLIAEDLVEAVRPAMAALAEA